MIKYVKGDATHPQGDSNNKIIAHVCNDVGGWGRGFVLALTKRWPEPELAYRRWFQDQEEMLLMPGHSDMKIDIPCRLGNVIYVPVEHEGYPPDFKKVTYVANMIAQRGIMPKDDGTQPIRYGALEECLQDVCKFVNDHLKGNASVHMPRIGCGLAGGRWSEIEPIIERALPNVDVTVYDYEATDASVIPWNK